MIPVSEAWENLHKQNVLPETFVEISYGAVDDDAQESASTTATNESVFSATHNVTETTAAQRYATLERNLWALNGTRTVLPDSDPKNIGYASQDNTAAIITLSFPTVMTTLVPGLTITWSSEYDEYATSFVVTARNGETVVATTTVTDNRDATSTVDIDLVNYDRITIEVLGWSLPDHRIRVDFITIGMGITFTKKDLFSFKHEQAGDLNSGALPKNSVMFSLDNSTGRWNPENPQGTEKYLSERQKITVRYGMVVGKDVEWINAGTFYLSEWSTPSQGMEATFVARDVFEYLLNEIYPEGETGTLRELVERAFNQADVPEDFTLHLAEDLDRYSAVTDDGRTAAAIVQMCANAAGCVIRQDRSGELHIEPLSLTDSGYVIPRKLSFTHPEINLSKPLKNVSVTYGEETSHVLTVGNTGETQTVDNPLITTEEQAAMVADGVRQSLVSRKIVSGDFRADPRLDLYDIVIVESKYGDIYPVVITDIAYQYSGSFWATYKGRVLSSEVRSL